MFGEPLDDSNEAVVKIRLIESLDTVCIVVVELSAIADRVWGPSLVLRDSCRPSDDSGALMVVVWSTGLVDVTTLVNGTAGAVL